MSYILKRLSPSVFVIRHQRVQIGRIVEKHDHSGGYAIARFNKSTVEATCSTPQQAFEEIAAACNRIAVCGVNDRAKAEAAIDERNAEVMRRARENPLIRVRSGRRFRI
jgi:hypothetical protein